MCEGNSYSQPTGGTDESELSRLGNHVGLHCRRELLVCPATPTHSDYLPVATQFQAIQTLIKAALFFVSQSEVSTRSIHIIVLVLFLSVSELLIVLLICSLLAMTISSVLVHCAI